MRSNINQGCAAKTLHYNRITVDLMVYVSYDWLYTERERGMKKMLIV